ncbi:MAG: polyprenyl synthetase family protein [Paludibacteraceae bacterium]|nr:polyprenyl synthetase family protein [Paludibacteraceae bacterium]
MIDVNEAIAGLDWSKEPQGLYAPIAYALSSGGKRLRMQLVLAGCRLVGGDEQDALPFAEAIEVFHNFTLLHDDVMDRADVRRGKPTVHIKWNDNTAILSGDQMLIEAYRLLEGVPQQHLLQLLRLFTKTATEICEGQQYDVDFEQRDDVQISDYIEMIRLKTSVLLAAALQGGAIIGGANETEQQALYNYGIHLGLAFQIQDDLLDCFGDPETFGKAIGGDISCNKKTYLLLSARDNADEKQRAELEHWLAQTEPSEAKIEVVKLLYVATKAREAAEQAIESHTQEALDCLRALPRNDETARLEQMALSLAKRNA